MAWVKIPKEHHPIFEAALPKDPRLTTQKMFGGVCAMVNGNMSAGLWAESVMVRLSASDLAKAMKLKGATPFDPMERGKPAEDMVVLPPSLMKSSAKLEEWIARAIAHTATMPPKERAAKKKTAAKKKKNKKSKKSKKS